MVFVRNLAFFVVLIAVLSFVFVLPVFAESNFQPQNLIGEWWADWNYRNIVSGKLFLTILSVEGIKVSGKFELTGAKAPNEEFKDGILEGNTLKITTEYQYIELVFEGKTLSGFALSDPYKATRSEIKNGVKVK
ncbi:MAG: hypothetical protein A3G49_02390 [Candidatus Sungbacteria bacterium RIFCSPLOWO2_12_FULL_41_11]|uniref:Uncharacterized protein n=1 Tax=Candidatus Sungbacteria bacterium RIFCSPLOWO2_12_FULL_41_11 TaxID=1802286 RepID=A0A1G2LNK2_9BACT|nr:MAG: hypothetical protein UV01_C0004G0068 [Parcubacteria group bacterium GW2011_GWA2_42_14]OGZ98126.1 MAG: hypothetical protein A3D41_04050 [Candidatus Sungbacteria bacterium RIFCSPHIGHO2_02_FULL_41_12b]OHA13190.1 MAG: hypothetical protein A3G49_02390 [Candidatus Sungbacteria bacterium RIFCSPLOWO2_12_FULL_41_11]